MGRSPIKELVLDAVTAGSANGRWITVEDARDISIVIEYTQAAGSSGTLSFQGTYDGTNTYPLEVQLGNGNAVTSKAYSTSLSEVYHVVGCHDKIRVSWVEAVTGYTISSWIIYQEGV